MRKHKQCLLSLGVAVLAALCLSTGVSAEVEWSTLKEIDLEETPLNL